MKYKTQMEAAKHGFVTDEMKIVAEKEGVSTDYLLEKIAIGEIIIPRNKNHNSISPEGIGTGDKKAYAPQLKYLQILNCGGKKAIMNYGNLSYYGKLSWWLKDRIDRKYMKV